MNQLSKFSIFTAFSWYQQCLLTFTSPYFSKKVGYFVTEFSDVCVFT